MSGGFSPADLRSAYKLPAEAGEGKTVAITIAYDNPKAESDLAIYRSQYGLPSCTTANGCFLKVNQKGEAGNYPSPGPLGERWAMETSLDLDMVSATCPKCHILLVEADSNEGDDLYASVDKAVELGANVVSDSWAGNEYSGEEADDHYFNHPGVPALFASGDWGYGAEYPPASSNVVAVGGTKLVKDGGARGWFETAWVNAGSGCSAFEKKPAWQKDEGCSKRSIADTSAVADVDTPVSVYDSYESAGWILLGGTSVATPLVAGVEALSSADFRAAGPSAFSRVGQNAQLFDPYEGENGSCGGYLCQGRPGYDGPTGWGTPNGPLSLPVAVTESATIQSTSKATLRGSVRPGGVNTEYFFEYGTTTAYGTSVPVPAASAGSGTEYVAVTRSIEGLKGQTTYHYRLTAINANGTFHGIDRKLGTTPPTATTMAASEIRSFHATLNATVNPQAGDTGYYFEYGSTPAYGTKAPLDFKEVGEGTADVKVSAPISGLGASKNYHYRVVAKNPAGTTYSEDEAFTTEPPEWRAQTLTQPAESGEERHGLGVSCAQPVLCVAVGAYWNIGVHARVTLAELWNGKTWSVMSTPNPAGLAEGWEFGREALLTGVSCASSSSCMAVGFYKNTEEIWRPLAESWNGTEWTMTTVPMPSGAQGSWLEGVSCTSSSQCTAIGRYKNSSGLEVTLAERWNGSTWTVQTSTNPSGASFARLFGVSCTSSTQCTAVGIYANSSGVELPFAEAWNGSAWTVQSTPIPGFASRGGLYAVSCSASTQCTAVGFFVNGYLTVPLLERWNGTAWSLQTPAEVPPYTSDTQYFAGVSCPSASSCTAVGAYYEPSVWYHGMQTAIDRPEIQRWDGTSWSLLEGDEVSAPASWWHDSWLSAISCAEATRCSSVGDSLAAPLGDFATPIAFADQTVKGPKVTTKAATTVGTFRATLNGTVNPEGSATSYHFEYGSTLSYGRSVPAKEVEVGSGTADIEVSQLVEGLEGGTTYHVRLVATNTEGTTYGHDVTLTTPAAVPLYASSFGTNGSNDGQFKSPADVVADGKGSLWVADRNNSRIEKFSEAGEFLSKFGSSGSTEGKFEEEVNAVALDPKGNIWVSDFSRIQGFTEKGEYITKSKFGSGQVGMARGLAIDAKGNFWVAATTKNQVLKFNEKGELLKTVASAGSAAGQVALPSSIDVGPGGNVWVADTGNNRVEMFNSNGEYQRSFGSEGTGPGQFKFPDGISVDARGVVWVADTGNNRVEAFTEAGNYLTQFGSKGSGEGQFSLSIPMGIATDSKGDIWVTDSGNSRVQKWLD